jgi:hypothetical protein
MSVLAVLLVTGAADESDLFFPRPSSPPRGLPRLRSRFEGIAYLSRRRLDVMAASEPARSVAHFGTRDLMAASFTPAALSRCTSERRLVSRPHPGNDRSLLGGLGARRFAHAHHDVSDRAALGRAGPARRPSRRGARESSFLMALAASARPLPPPWTKPTRSTTSRTRSEDSLTLGALSALVPAVSGIRRRLPAFERACRARLSFSLRRGSPFFLLALGSMRVVARACCRRTRVETGVGSPLVGHRGDFGPFDRAGPFRRDRQPRRSRFSS